MATSVAAADREPVGHIWIHNNSATVVVITYHNDREDGGTYNTHQDLLAGQSREINAGAGVYAVDLGVAGRINDQISKYLMVPGEKHLERSYYGTLLGMDIYNKWTYPNG